MKGPVFEQSPNMTSQAQTSPGSMRAFYQVSEGGLHTTAGKSHNTQLLMGCRGEVSMSSAEVMSPSTNQSAALYKHIVLLVVSGFYRG